MVFSSIVFLCIFLPVVLVLYRLCPGKYRNIVLLGSSLIFYAWGEPIYIIVMVFTTIFDFLCGLAIERQLEAGNVNKKKAVLVAAIVVNLGLLCFFKYTNFIIENINSALGCGLGLLELALPIGISFYSFQALSYVIDVYRGVTKAQHSLIDFAMYISMFPQLIAGPIVRYIDIEDQLKVRTIDPEMTYDGIKRFLVGLGKKVLIANQVGAMWDEIYSYGGTTEAGVAWLGALCFTFQIYYDFSGYSDMAIGLGKMLGFTFPENFNYPYISKSITEFWRRWHMTLGTWFREYLYIPLGGNRKGMKRQILNLFIVWALTGLWHGASWNFILWGLYFFVILMMEKLFLLKFLAKCPPCVGHVYALILIVFGWAIFACDNIEVLGNYIGSMFGAFGGATASTHMLGYYLTELAFPIVIMSVGSTQLPKRLWEKAMASIGEKGEFWVTVIGCLVVLILCIVFLVGDSYNPFLYFRF